MDKIRAAGADTLITGELRQHHFNLAQELRRNLYACGHYATETFGVDASPAKWPKSSTSTSLSRPLPCDSRIAVHLGLGVYCSPR